MNFQTMNKQRKFILISAGIGIIGMFLPWIKFGSFVNINGMHGWGILVFLSFVGVCALACIGNLTKALEKKNWFITLIFAAIASLIMVIFYIRLTDNPFFSPSFLSFGFYISVLATIGVFVSAYLFRSPSDNIKDGFDSVKGSINQK